MPVTLSTATNDLGTLGTFVNFTDVDLTVPSPFPDENPRPEDNLDGKPRLHNDECSGCKL